MSKDIGCPDMVGKGERVPTKVDWATPAAMKSEIPLPIPHLLTSSSRRKTSREPRKSWITMTATQSIYRMTKEL